MITTIIKQHIERAALVGWRPRPRASVTVHDGRAVVRIQYRSDAGLWAVNPGDPEDGNGIDMTDMPPGVSVLAWDAPPDDLIELPEIPGDSGLRAIAATMGHAVTHRMRRADGATIYWLDRRD